MKRKHTAEEEETASSLPKPEVPETPSAPANDEPSFSNLGLDPRLLQAIAQLKYQKPTLVQHTAIPLAINERKDILAKAKTGSGKTAAFVLPVLHQILQRKAAKSAPATTALILVPVRDLADQISKAVAQFSAFCASEVRTVKLTDKVNDNVLRDRLASLPDIVIATPTKAWECVTKSFLSLDNITYLALDEADLILQHGYKEDLENVAQALPTKGVQTVLMSATLTTDVDTVKSLFCKDPVVLDLEEPDAEGQTVTQYVVKCSEDDKFLLAYIIFKLKLVTGKCIIFVADVDRSYRLHLFLHMFGLRSTVLNSELPVLSRMHVVEEFNQNVYDIIIAADETEILGDEILESEPAEGSSTAAHDTSKKTKEHQKKKRKTASKDYGVSRGIDFKNVACVLNFDLPANSKSYTHRIGRTARAGKSGMALSFVVPTELYRKHIPTTTEACKNDEKVLARIIKQQSKLDREIKDYVFDMKQAEAFRYRMTDALRAVTKVAVREARLKELRQELLNSEKLQRHFQEHPEERNSLVRNQITRETSLRAARVQPHLKHVPDYLLPEEGKKALTSEEIGFVPMNKAGGRRDKKRFFRGKGKKPAGRKADPLRTFKVKRKAK